MNNDSGDGIHPWTDPELEARIVAMVLGEASEFEREELERHIAKQPELRRFKDRMESLHEMLREEGAGGNEWKLAPQRRKRVLAADGDDGARKLDWVKVAIWSAAACLIVGTIVALCMPVGEGALRKVRTTAAETQPPEKLNASTKSRSTRVVPKPARKATTGVKANEKVQRGLADGEQEAAVSSLRKSPDLRSNAPVIEDRSQDLNKQLADASVRRSRELLSQGRRSEAGEMLEQVLESDPSNAEALALVDELVALGKTLKYDRYISSARPEHAARFERLKASLKAADGYRRLGDYDEAERNFHEALSYDPYNSDARKGLELVEKERREYYDTAYDQTRAGFLGEVEAQWETSVPKSDIDTVDDPFTALGDGPGSGVGLESQVNDLGYVHSLEGNEYTNTKLKRIIIPEIEFDETPLENALEFLRQKAIELDDLESDPSRKGVNLNVIAPQGKPSESEDIDDGFGFDDDLGFDDPSEQSSGAGSKPITLKLTNVPLIEALRYTTQLARMKFRVDPHGISVIPITESSEDMVTQVYHVPPSFLDSSGSLNPDPDDPFADLSGGFGESAQSSRNKNARETLESVGISFPQGSTAHYNPSTSQLIIRNTQSNVDLVEAYVSPLCVVAPATLPPPMPPPIRLPDPEEERIRQHELALKRIIIPELEFQDTPLTDALAFFESKTSELSQEGQSPLSFRVAPELAEDREITLVLRNVPLGEAIRYTGQLARLEYQVEPSGVVRLVKRGQRDHLMPTHVYMVPADKMDYLRKGQSVRQCFETSGVIFPPGASVSYDAIQGALTIRNTRSNLEIAHAILDALHAQHYHATTPEEADLGLLEIATTQEPVSTFSLHVSDVSFGLAHAALREGKWPENAIRIEEFVNAFDYGDPKPSQSQKIACRLEQSPHPFIQKRNLLRVSLRTAAAGRGQNTPLRLTLVLDASGSMERADRRAILRRAVKELAGQLRAEDSVTLIAFARTPRLVAEGLASKDAAKLVSLATKTPSEGGTNLEAALVLAAEKTRELFLPNAQNRIVLLTDGAANLGDADPKRLAEFVQRLKQERIAFDAAGIGAGGLNDEILEALTRKGDGRYYLLNRPEDAAGGFAGKLAGAFRPAAMNVKVQVRFNPKRVASYRLMGFDKHILQEQDFRDDDVDAAELAAEEAGVALYHYQPLPDGQGAVGRVLVRFFDVDTGQTVERGWPIPHEVAAARFEDAAPGIQLASAAAFVAARLANDPVGWRVELDELPRALARLPRSWRAAPRIADLDFMIRKTQALASE